ncbi:zinc finger HIT domain-containing protein 1-like [Corticium candelabrum]|uniref:zinc finger HIT domain-containing protein 1-like n=1 Tax=Corticium candelabrum TaxID=121492 RepID=UPI002E271122|nr:zinc finger HIT domain-containing protein 1-like [Corticium candelabrum]
MATRKLRNVQGYRVLDEAARQRRLKRQLEALERDNHHDDPHQNVPQITHKLPSFSDGETGRRVRRSKTEVRIKQRFRRTFTALLEELQNDEEAKSKPNYLTIAAPPSKFPERKFCAVCGFPSAYTCVACGARYCSVRCLGTHKDTRCLKWTA